MSFGGNRKTALTSGRQTDIKTGSGAFVVLPSIHFSFAFSPSVTFSLSVFHHCFMLHSVLLYRWPLSPSREV